jgi:hypothetical protein
MPICDVIPKTGKTRRERVGRIATRSMILYKSFDCFTRSLALYSLTRYSAMKKQTMITSVFHRNALAPSDMA